MRRGNQGIELEDFEQQAFFRQADFKNHFFPFGPDEFHLITLHGRMQGVFLELVDIKFRLFHAFTRQHAFALVMDLQHVDLGFLPLPAEDNLKHMRHVVHQVDRVVPANDPIARFEVGARIGFLVLVDAGPHFRSCRGRHDLKIKRPGATVEGAGDGFVRKAPYYLTTVLTIDFPYQKP
jgi:hypothetical protein